MTTPKRMKAAVAAAAAATAAPAALVTEVYDCMMQTSRKQLAQLLSVPNLACLDFDFFIPIETQQSVHLDAAQIQAFATSLRALAMTELEDPQASGHAK